MQHRFLLGTRKGLFVLRRDGRGWSFGEPAHLGNPIASISGFVPFAEREGASRATAFSNSVT